MFPGCSGVRIEDDPPLYQCCGFMVAVYGDPSNPDDGRKGVVYVTNANIEVGGPFLPE
ncbi:hypothetical protein HMPREF9004_0400 [Schaalia cardiffensis F0333]|uniref:Uncharacterized protein n=1 Tax=Schaalia cardiffensis F0333 TaxID=888050 RepID=N6W861_9ACTO|nr:hypothetical protein HMPREF9004_0400 [Schaalia cardiffensis F0333]